MLVLAPQDFFISNNQETLKLLRDALGETSGRHNALDCLLYLTSNLPTYTPSEAVDFIIKIVFVKKTAIAPEELERHRDILFHLVLFVFFFFNSSRLTLPSQCAARFYPLIYQPPGLAGGPVANNLDSLRFLKDMITSTSKDVHLHHRVAAMQALSFIIRRSPSKVSSSNMGVCAHLCCPITVRGF